MRINCLPSTRHDGLSILIRRDLKDFFTEILEIKILDLVISFSHYFGRFIVPRVLR